MKILCISDVHSNLAALKQIQEKIPEIKPDLVVCLGDVVGYAAEPNEVCSIIREIADVTLLGNHDAAVGGILNFDYYYPAARNALYWTKQVLDKSHIQWLKGLPYTYSQEECFFSHGDPTAPERFDYIYMSSQVYPLIEAYSSMKRVTFIGHSHLTKTFAFNESSVMELEGDSFNLEPDWKYVVTVGSVGQPRDGDPRACCLVYDTEERRVEYIRASYDIDSTANKIIAEGLDSEFAYRLYYGR